MSEIPAPGPAPTSAELEALRDLVDLLVDYLPEGTRDLIARVVCQVEVEREACKVGRLHRARLARAHQLALLGQCAAAAEVPDDDRKAFAAESIDYLNRYRAYRLGQAF